jgi:hypothetical protein
MHAPPAWALVCAVLVTAATAAGCAEEAPHEGAAGASAGADENGEPSGAVDESVAAAAEASSSSLASRLIGCAQSDLGQTIGGGQCTDLVAAAMSCALACLPTKDLVWGAKKPAGAVQPGDIIQFDQLQTETHPNGGDWIVTRGAPDHTAIVETVSGTDIGLIEQNINGDPTERGDFDTTTIISGSYIVYRPGNCDVPTPPPPTQAEDGASIAFSPATHQVGFASGQGANEAALSSCQAAGATDCRVMVTKAKGCVALWAGTHGWATGHGATLTHANASAQKGCGKHGHDCVQFTDICVDGSQ